MSRAVPRITFARLLLEVRRRAVTSGPTLKPSSLRETLAALGELAAKEVTGEAEAVRRILGAIVRVQSELEIDGQALEVLTPETIVRLDAVLVALLDGGITENELRTILRRALIRTVH